MNIQKLYDMQRTLDQHILDKHEELKGQDNLDWKVLALQVELGECANEWRGFKKWSNDRKPRITQLCSKCRGKGFKKEWNTANGTQEEIECSFCEGSGSTKNPLLEEYVDCLHFVLSIGLEIGIADYTINENLSKPERYGDKSIIKRFSSLIGSINTLLIIRPHVRAGVYNSIFDDFIKLGYQLGFTWEQIEQAYFDKNKVNHERQLTGY